MIRIARVRVAGSLLAECTVTAAEPEIYQRRLDACYAVAINQCAPREAP
jgi:hypothetical protein